MTTTGEHVFRAASLTALVACLVATGIAMAQKVVPGWDGSPLLLVCALAAIEAYAAYRLTGGGSLKSALAHAAVFLLLAQLYVDALYRHAPFQAGTLYVNGRAFAYLLPVILTWLALTSVMRQLAILERPPEEGFLDRSPVRSLTLRFFLAGSVLFAAAALTQPDVARLFKLRHADGAGPLLNVFAYFLIGVILLSRLEYDAMRHRWQAQRTVVPAGMASRWMRYVLLFAGAVVLLAFVLPTSQTLGVLGPGHDAWNELVLLLRGPLSNLLSLLHPSRPTKIDPHLKPPPGFHLPPHHPTMPRQGTGQGGSWYATIQTILFWTGLLVLVGYLVRAWIRRGHRRRGGPRVARISGLRSALARFWSALVRRMRSVLAAAGERLPDSLGGRLVAPSLRGRRASVRGALGGPTGHQILAYYQRMVRQAQRRGVRRTPAQTPEEFAAIFSPEVPQAAGDVALLTEAFVEARYSRHEIPDTRLGPVRAGWERIRAALASRGRRTHV
jgi:hypothetical protein